MEVDLKRVAIHAILVLTPSSGEGSQAQLVALKAKGLTFTQIVDLSFRP
jgi:hypothetical protein